MYREDFEHHWGNLQSAFNIGYGRLMDRGQPITTRTVNSLYEGEALKWTSMIAPPGKWLDGADPAFASQIRAEVSGFRFSPLPTLNRGKIYLIGAVLAIALGVLFIVLISPGWLSWLVGVLAFFAFLFLTFGYAKREEKNSDKKKLTYCQNAMETEKQKLLTICDSFDK